jgi:glycosyltransferase involved in cell wall biosynthesis
MARVLIIVPAYNETATIAAVLDALRLHCPNYSVLVIDDGSTDDTGHLVASVPGVELIQLPYNLGIGGAVQTGYRYALREGFDIAVQCDADGQHPVEDIPRLVAKLEEGIADMVIGSRYVASTQYVPSLYRRIGKSLLSRLVNAIAGGGITDTTSGFRAMNRDVLRVFAKHYPDDYPEAEALIILYKAGLKAIEVPVEMHARQGGITSISPVKAAYYIVKVSIAILVDLFRRFTRTPEEAP